MPSKDSSNNHGHTVPIIVDQQRVQLVLLEIASLRNNANAIVQNRGNQPHRQAYERACSATATTTIASRRVTTRASNRQSVASSTRGRNRNTTPSTIISSIQQSLFKRSSKGSQQRLCPDFNLEHLHILMTSRGASDGNSAASAKRRRMNCVDHNDTSDINYND